MPLKFNHHTRFVKRCYNGLKKADDVENPEKILKDEVDGDGLENAFDGIRKMRRLDEPLEKSKNIIDINECKNSNDSNYHSDSENSVEDLSDDSNNSINSTEEISDEKEKSTDVFSSQPVHLKNTDLVDTIINDSSSEKDEFYPSKEINCNEAYKSHTSMRFPPTEKKKYPTRRCVVCKKNGYRCDTRYHCQVCNVAVCKSPCFKEYHSV